MDSMSTPDRPSAAERAAITAKLDAEGSRYTLAVVIAEYDAYVKRVHLHSTWVPPFTEWLGASGWMD